MSKNAAIEATVSTLAILGAIALFGGIVYLAKHYVWAEYGVLGAFVAFCVYAVWINIYNESKARENATGWESIGG